MEYIDVTPIKEAVAQALANGDSLSAICRRMGWVKMRPVPETSRLQRMIGNMKYETHGRKFIAARITKENVELIADALNLDPRDIGL